MFKKVILSILFLFVVFSIGILTIPSPVVSYSKVLYSSDDQLIGARLSKDEQWRFEPGDSLPFKYKIAVTVFEDEYFYYHPGINPISILKAGIRNIQAGKVIAGGSTLSMQNIRLRRGFDKKRNIWNKLIECFWALALEIRYSKSAILRDYGARAPFGTNVIGLDAACWRYYEKEPPMLSWAEACLLAVLPNSPSLIHPGKNRSLLKQKRDRLLKKLLHKEMIDTITYALSVSEEIPSAPKPLPAFAPHALDYLILKNPTQNSFHSSINLDIQGQLNELAYWSYANLSANKIKNMGLLVADTESGDVLAYVGNAPGSDQSIHVDHIQAERSTGSILKPFLYMGAQYRGVILPKTILSDIPSVIDGFQPKNFSLQYQGTISADKALVQSLNIPFVYLLKQYGTEQFLLDLKRLHIKSINKTAGHYGLSLILGGAEASLWDITGAYASLGRSLLHYSILDNKYQKEDIRPLRFIHHDALHIKTNTREPIVYSNASIYNAFHAMQDIKRPDESGNWNSFSSTMPLAWKTGTSYGFRDAWAIGVNSKYTVGVWVGNSSGEGRPGLLGIKVAAPILFDIVSRLPDKNIDPFEVPWDELVKIPVCIESGMKPNEHCTTMDTTFVCRFQNNTLPCLYHRSVFVNAQGNMVNQSCITDNTLKKSYFTLPPLVEYYYSILHPAYEKLPAMDPDCEKLQTVQMMNMIHPVANSKIYIPKDLQGNPGSVIFKLAHRSPEINVHWHLDETYIGTTNTFHEISIQAKEGFHELTVVDALGNELKLPFTVLNK